MKAKEELGQIYRLREEIECLMERKRQAMDLVLKVTGDWDGMPKSRGGDKLGCGMGRMADLSCQIEAKVAEYDRLHRLMAQKIGRIHNRDYRLVLELRYLNFNTFEVIAEKMGCSVRHVFRLQAAALREYEKLG